MSSEILACPYCKNGVPKVIGHVYKQVECDICNMAGPRSSFDHYAIAEWNKLVEKINSAVNINSKEYKILKLKAENTLANNLCPDHRDKQVGKPCLACTIEKLESSLSKANEDIIELQNCLRASDDSGIDL